MLKSVLSYPFFLINLGKLFHREGSNNEIAFCPMLVLRKEFLSSANLFLASILQCGAIQRFLSDIKDECY